MAGCTHREPLFGPKPGPRTQPRCWFASIPSWRHLRGRRSEYDILECFWIIHGIQRKLDHERAGKHATGSTITSVSSTLYSTPFSTSCCSTYSTTYSGASCAGYITAVWRAYIAWSEHKVAVREKSLIEPEGDTYLLYYPFTKYEMLLVCNSMLLVLSSCI